MDKKKPIKSNSKPSRKSLTSKQYESGLPDAVLENFAQSLDVLFDPENFTHLPLDSQTARYRQKNLAAIRYYKDGLKYFGGLRTVMEMLGPTKQRYRKINVWGGNAATASEEEGFLPPIHRPIHKAAVAVGGGDATASVMQQRESSIRARYQARRQVYESLQQMEDICGFLENKPELNPIEKNYLKLMRSNNAI